jgi:hypothetical protein
VPLYDCSWHCDGGSSVFGVPVADAMTLGFGPALAMAGFGPALAMAGADQFGDFEHRGMSS